MSSYTTLNKLNLSPLQSKFFVNKGDIDVDPEISIFNYSHCMPSRYEGAPIDFSNTLSGKNPYSTQRYYSKRILTNNTNAAYRIIAKIPFVEGSNTEYIKPYRSGFSSYIFFSFIKEGVFNNSFILKLEGSFPTTIDATTDIQTTKTLLTPIIENVGDYEYYYLDSPPSSLMAFGFEGSEVFDFFFTIGTNTNSNVDQDVDSTDPNYIYIGTYFEPISIADKIIIKTSFEYI